MHLAHDVTCHLCPCWPLIFSWILPIQQLCHSGPLSAQFLVSGMMQVSPAPKGQGWDEGVSFMEWAFEEWRVLSVPYQEGWATDAKGETH